MMYPHLDFEENRRQREREQKLQNQIYLARREAKERRKASRTPLLFRVRQVFRPRREPCPKPCPEPM